MGHARMRTAFSSSAISRTVKGSVTRDLHIGGGREHIFFHRIIPREKIDDIDSKMVKNCKRNIAQQAQLDLKWS
jgi:hypothetical protein